MNLSSPLTDQEFDELVGFLVSSATHEDSMDISMLDGFLTAVIVGPNILPPSRWLSTIWGGPMIWQSKQQAKYMLSLVLRHAYDILNILCNHPETFRPYLYEREDAGGKIVICAEWCAGFTKGIALDEESWRPLMASEEGARLIYPIILHGTEAGWKELKKSTEAISFHEVSALTLGNIVMAIRAWWLPIRKAQLKPTHLPKANMVEDIDCPCGSGRKIRYCYCDARILH